MDSKKLRLVLGLPEDATDEQVASAVDTWEPPKEESNDAGGGSESGEQQSVAASEALKKLAEDSPAVKQLMDLVEAQGNEIKATTRQLREEKVSRQLAEFDNNDKRKLTPKGRTLLSEILLGDATGETIGNLVKGMADGTLTVELGERGARRTSSGDLDDKTATQRFAEAVEKLQDEKKISFSEAATIVSSKEPELFQEYTSEVATIG
jgi:hypothetical protein